MGILVQEKAEAPRHGQFPEWIRRQWACGEDFAFTRALVQGLSLHTVCQSARCPNLGECWRGRTATFMILGNLCTRNCRYCSVPSGRPKGWVDEEEPEKVARAVLEMNLRHAVITSVTRDDLPDGGAAHFAASIKAVRRLNPPTTIEVLTPDFLGNPRSIATVLESSPEVFGHNIETVRGLYGTLRGQRYAYDLGLTVLRMAASFREPVIIKSAIMVGHGETSEEVRRTLLDLLEAGCEAVCIGQYLRPSKKQREVVEFVHPDQFRAYEELAYALGFQFAVAGPFVRSSYRSEQMMQMPFARERFARRREQPGRPGHQLTVGTTRQLGG